MFYWHYFPSSGKLVWPSQLPFLPACSVGMAWGGRLPSAVCCSPGPPAGEGRHSEIVSTPASGYRSGDGWQHSWNLPARVMQSLGCWNGQSRQASVCPTPEHCPALPVDTRHLSSDWTRDRGGVWVNPQLPPAYFCRASETTLLPKVKVWPPTVARLNLETLPKDKQGSGGETGVLEE